MSNAYNLMTGFYKPRAAPTQPTPATPPAEQEEKNFSPPQAELPAVPQFLPDPPSVEQEEPAPAQSPRVVEELFEPDRRSQLFRHLVEHLNCTPQDAEDAMTQLPYNICDNLDVLKTRFIILVHERNQYDGLSQMFQFRIVDAEERYFYGQLMPGGDNVSEEEASRAFGLVVDASRWGKLFLAKPEDVLYQLWGNRFEMLRNKPYLLPHIVVMGAPYAIDNKQIIRVFERRIYMVRNQKEAHKIFGQLVGSVSGGCSRDKFVQDVFDAHRPCIGCALPLNPQIPFEVCSEGHDVCGRCIAGSVDQVCPCQVFAGVGLEKKIACAGRLKGEEEVAAEPVPMELNRASTLGTVQEAQPMVIEDEQEEEEEEEEDSGEVIFDFRRPAEQEEQPPRRTGKSPKLLRPGKRKLDCQPECKHSCTDKYECNHSCCKKHFLPEIREAALQEMEDRLLAEKLQAKPSPKRGRSRSRRVSRDAVEYTSPPRGRKRTRRRKKAKRRSRSRSVTPSMSPVRTTQDMEVEMENDANPHNVPPMDVNLLDPALCVDMSGFSPDFSDKGLGGLFGDQGEQHADFLTSAPMEWPQAN